MAASTPLGLEWLDTLEGEFDSVFRVLHLGLSSLSPGEEEEEEEEEASMSDSVSAMASVFTQLVCKTKAVFQTNCKLEVSLELLSFISFQLSSLIYLHSCVYFSSCCSVLTVVVCFHYACVIS